MIRNPTFEASQDLFYALLNKNNAVQVYSKRDSAQGEIAVTDWPDEYKASAYRALVCLLSIIRPPLDWCLGENKACTNPSDVELMTWIQGGCLGNPKDSEMCGKLETWRENFGILGSNWQLASSLVLSDSPPDDIGRQEDKCIYEDARRQAVNKVYNNCKGVSSLPPENYGASFDPHNSNMTSEKGAGVAGAEEDMAGSDIGKLLSSVKSQAATKIFDTKQEKTKQDDTSDHGALADVQVTASAPSKSKSFNWPLFGAITGVVVLAIVLIIGFVFLKKKADSQKK